MVTHGRRTPTIDVFGALWFLLSIFVISSLRSTSADDDDLLPPVNTVDQSICTDYHRVNLTRREPYIVTYWSDYGGYRLTKTNYKDEHYTKWAAVEMCCPGYEPLGLREDAEQCVPVCPSGCQYGQCERPNKCNCHPGYEESTNATTGFSECSARCSSGCHGGRCTEPEICTCDPGFTSTEDRRGCRASCDGVRGDDQLTGCGAHSTCVAPDTCRCDDGYAALPTPGPTAATWTMITNKTASTGFTTRSRTTDYPFNYSNMTTAPPPSLPRIKQIVCAPVCKPECGKNARCTGPNLCECDSGYLFAAVLSAVSNVSAIDCSPVCEPACVNGDCIGPNECSCRAGYEPHRALGAILCEPACRNGCINGRCAGPNRCECATGYRPLVMRGVKATIDNICEPICVTECPNGRCFAPGRCHCDRGYAPAPANGTAVGHDGYDSIADSTNQETCRPICENGCPAGSVCVGPNRCDDGDESVDEATRLPTFNDTKWTTKGDKAELKSGDVAGSVIGIIVGLVLAVGVGGAIYLLFQRFRRNRSLKGASLSNNPMLERNNPESPFASMKSSQDL